MRITHYDKIRVEIHDSMDAAGEAAAANLATILRETVAAQGKAAIIVATGNSQLSFLKALRERKDIAWDKITVFHMDEYLGMSDRHPASFRGYLRRNLVDHVQPRAFHGIAGDSPDVQAEMARYADLLVQHAPIACVLGIGENGHIAFNDPPADFTTDKLIQVVSLAEAARRQQVGEGYFAGLDEVPRQAVSLTVPMLLRPSRVLAVVPEARKAAAVKSALQGPVSPNCPASILRTCSQVSMYLDPESAARL